MPRAKPFQSSKKKKIMKCLQNKKKVASINEKTLSRSFTQKEEYMAESYTKIKKKNQLLVLDLDGTIVKYGNASDNFMDIATRPYLNLLLKTISPYYDIVVYSNNTPKRVAYICHRYLSKYVKLWFDCRQTDNGKKNIMPMQKLNNRIIFLEDTLANTNTESELYVYKIPRWKGETNDKWLMKLISDLLDFKDEGEWNIEKWRKDLKQFIKIKGIGHFANLKVEEITSGYARRRANAK